MVAATYAAYGTVGALGIRGGFLAWLWLPPLAGAYAGIVLATQTMLGLPRPRVVLRDMIVGSALFGCLFALLAFAGSRGLVPDSGIGAALVAGAGYVLLGLAFIRERAPVVFGALVMLGAGVLWALDAHPGWTTLFGIVFVGGMMVAIGTRLLRRTPVRRAPPGEPSDLEAVRDTLHRLKDHDERVRSRGIAGGALTVGAVLASAAVPATAARSDLGLGLLAAALALLAVGSAFLRRGVGHGA